MKKNKLLFFVFLGLFIIDLIIPDPLPIVDELVLGAFTLYFGAKK
jgi:hypothetical protein